MDISIIVPVYNVEQYLKRCLDSLFSQKFDGTFEVIAVDDGSTDRSLQLLYEYQKHDERLKVIKHPENRKLSVARTTGMKFAKGDYIMHVDSDDWLLPGALAYLHGKIAETSSDIVVFNYVKENSEGGRTPQKKIKKELITNDQAIVLSHFFGCCCNKIVRKSFTENMIYGEVSVNTTEDLLYSIEILLQAGKICLVPESFYVYFTNTNSITYSILPEQYLQNQIIILQQLQKVVARYNPNTKTICNTINYLEKWIYLGVAKTHFRKNEKKLNYTKLVKAFSDIPMMGRYRIKRLELSIKSSFFCLLEIAYRFRFRMIREVLAQRLIA